MDSEFFISCVWLFRLVGAPTEELSLKRSESHSKLFSKLVAVYFEMPAAVEAVAVAAMISLSAVTDCIAVRRSVRSLGDKDKASLGSISSVSTYWAVNSGLLTPAPGD